MSWKNNALMEWGGSKVTDHGRLPLNESVQRFGTDKRMADGSLRRYHITTKRQWNVSWENLPDKRNVNGALTTVDDGMSGSEIEAFYAANPGVFRMVLRRGSAINQTTPAVADSQLPYDDGDFYIVNVMFGDFSKERRARGMVDFWNISVTLEEV